MERRDFLKVSGGLSAYSIVGGSLLSIRRAEADTGLPIAALQAALDPKKDLVLVPGSKAAAANMTFPSTSERRSRRGCVWLPEVPRRSAATIRWATNNGIGFADPLGRSLL